MTHQQYIYANTKPRNVPKHAKNVSTRDFSVSNLFCPTPNTADMSIIVIWQQFSREREREKRERERERERQRREREKREKRERGRESE